MTLKCMLGLIFHSTVNNVQRKSTHAYHITYTCYLKLNNFLQHNIIITFTIFSQNFKLAKLKFQQVALQKSNFLYFDNRPSSE